MIVRTVWRIRAVACLLGLGLASGLVPVAHGADPAEEARRIFRATGVQGGLVVHLECGEGRLTAELRRNESYTVHGLDRDAEDVGRARDYIHSRGLYGPVSVDHRSGDGLPYADNLVNLLVSERPLDVPEEEVMRVLRPHGVACVKKAGKWTNTVKPWPADIDEWTHYLHGPDNNAVAQDSRVAPPRYARWKNGPMWCRSHEYNSSVAAVVSAEGRLFSIMDEGIIGTYHDRFPPRWFLVARDAFNGVTLWKRPMGRWGASIWGNVGFRSNPQVLPRRLVAVGDRVYVTFSYFGPLSILDAATGETLRVCEETEQAYEIVSSDGLVVVRVRKVPEGNPRRKAWEEAQEMLVALDGESGEVVWKQETELMVPLSLSIDSGRVCYHNYREIVCRDLQTGRELWRAPCRARSKPRSAADGRWHIRNLGTLIIYKGVVLFTSPDGLEAFSLADGEKLWTGPRVGAIAPTQPVGLFGAQGLVWPTGAPGSIRGAAVNMKGYDPRTGELRKTVSVSQLLSPYHHVRCYRSKATERYLILPKRGAEFVDLMGDDHARHDWLRAPCSYGSLPANGLLYMPPSQCFCYPGVKLAGFNALSAHAEVTRAGQAQETETRLRKGPAWGSDLKAETDPRRDWPTYRHDILRSGCTKASLPVELDSLWERELGAELTPPVEANGRLFVASEDTHTLRCLDADTGEDEWSYTTGGRIDSPPTVHRGLVLFGSMDGRVYCLRASDGKLVWRFRAAPAERLVGVFDQLESAWPVHGNVLVQDGVAYFAAGRSSFLDGGIDVFGLDPETGRVLHRHHLQSEPPDVSTETGRPYDMDGARSDVLVSDGTDLYMFQVCFSPDLTRKEAPRLTRLGDRKMGLHLITTQGFTDDSWFNRTYWTYSRRWPGFYFSYHGPKSGQILAFDEDTTYGVKVFRRRRGWSPTYTPEEMDYELFADSNSNEPELLKGPLTEQVPEEWLRGLPGGRKQTARGTGRNWQRAEKGLGFTRAEPPKWAREVPVRISAMVLAGDRLYVAGAPNVVPEDDPLGAFEGRLGSRLWVVSTKDGSKLAEYELDHLPEFDGLIAARGRLYLVTRDGNVLCLGRE